MVPKFSNLNAKSPIIIIIDTCRLLVSGVQAQHVALEVTHIMAPTLDGLLHLGNV